MKLVKITEEGSERGAVRRDSPVVLSRKRIGWLDVILGFLERGRLQLSGAGIQTLV
jgi:hypothetical protein